MMANTASVEKVLDWVRAHPLPGGRIIPVCIWGDRGSGKCLSAQSPIIVNGHLRTIKEAFSAYADLENLHDDGEGEWSLPTEQLQVPTLTASGAIELREVKHLYRQKVREVGQKVTLSDGSEITMTKAHRLRGLRGWQNQFEVGDHVAVPRQIPWQGEAVDPDLVTLLAWQISEGSEAPATGCCRITQKDGSVLERVKTSAQAWSERSGVDLNGMPIVSHSSGRAAYLQITSTPYRRYLEERDYAWGKKSAEKRIPDWIVAADDATVALFLSEFFAAEAHVGKSHFELTMASEWMMRQVQLMLRRFGIWMRLKPKRARATNGANVWRTYWRGQVSGPSLRLLTEKVGIADQSKQARLDEIAETKSNTNIEGIPFRDLMDELRKISGLPQRALDFPNRAIRTSKTLTRRRLEPFVNACTAVAEQRLVVEPVNVKDSWAVTTQRKLEALYEDEAAMATFAAAATELSDRLAMDVYWARVEKVEEVELDEYVYDLEVEETHNYVASMICTHNTQLLRAYCAKRQFGFRGMHPAHNTDGSDIVGLAYFDEKIERTVHARPLWLPSENDPISWQKKGLIFIDEINRAPEAVLQGLMEPLGEGTVEQSEWRLPEDWGFVCAANPPREGYHVARLDEALMDRMLHIPLGFDPVRWIAWAGSTDIPEEVLNFTARFPDLMAKTETSLESLEIKATPRSMEYLARLYEPGMDLDFLRLIASGLIGETAADAFINHLKQTDNPVTAVEVLSGDFKEKLSAHISAGRQDLINASRDLLVGKLANSKYIEGKHDPLARQVAAYAQMLGQEGYKSFWQQLVDNAPHWAGPVRRALEG